MSFSAVLPLTLLARGLLDALGLSKSSPSLSVSDNWASSSLELWELLHFSSDAGFSSLLLSSDRQLLVLRRVLDRRITWSFSHSFLNRWTGPEIKKEIVDTLFPEAYHLIRFCSLYLYILRGGRDGAVVRTCTSHQCGPGSIPARCHMWVEFVVSSRPCSEGFPPSSKTNTPNSNSTKIEDPHENQLRLMWPPLQI